ncbi:MAG: 2',3'-cyclic-nucleotide 2'-phosphodiesterase (5'-nucleotidase family) [Kiritimatiellia bacterium]|jgi:2',3'-cyclic-nucleotide 2'-phosphodiesterase (5'-nucleotidase family)
MRLALLFVLALGSCKAPPAPAVPTPTPVQVCGLQPDGNRHFKILHLNDIYRIEGLADGRGGLARVRTLRASLEQNCSAVLVTHAGDTLFPSILSRHFKGAQMIEVLNALDGETTAFDQNMIATFGNHEFDKSKLKYAPLLDARVDESQFTWLDSNIAWKEGDDGQPLISADHLMPQRMMDLGGVKVGVFSLTIDNKIPMYVQHIDTDYVAVAATQVADLREQGAELVIALTHLDARTDVVLLEELSGQNGPDIVLGGHDHILMTKHVGDRAVIKGDADALRVRVVDMWVDPEGNVGWSASDEGEALGSQGPAYDADVKQIVDGLLATFDKQFCADEGEGCLEQQLTVAGTELVAEELQIRRFETNLGNWIADRMLETFEPDGVQIAFVNSGALRLNQNLAVGTPVTRQVVEEIFAYPAGMQLLEIDGATLKAVLHRSVQDWTGSGHWLQVAGVAFRHDVDGSKVADAVLLTPDGPVPLNDSTTYRVVTVDYLVSPEMGDQDGYTMLSKKQAVASERVGTDLKKVVLQALIAAGEGGIAPEVDGRICNVARAGPCQVP